MDYTEQKTSFSFFSHQNINVDDETIQNNTLNHDCILNFTSQDVEENETNQNNIHEDSEDNILDFTNQDSEDDTIEYNYEFDSELDENSDNEGNLNIIYYL